MKGAIIDINADLGEFPESLANGADFELMHYVSSVNIACGGHAGDAATMRQTLANAKKLNLAAGAHPSYPDRANFGRVELPLAPKQLESAVHDQITALADVAQELGLRLAHVKPHGALYHAANRSRDVATALGRTVLAIDPELIVVGLAGSPALDRWREMGLRCAAEAFADRAYEPDGNLRRRSLPGALLDDPLQAAQQAIAIALRHRVNATDGRELPVLADTICIHSDTPGAASIAREVNRQLKSAGVRIAPLR